MYFDCYTYTSKGGRSYNQDAVGVNGTHDGLICVAADGLGGHLHGEMAAKCAVDSVLASAPCVEEEQIEWLKVQISQANESILELQKQHGSMKTTIAVLSVIENQAAWAHVGDTRLYYLHNRAIEAYTEDHSVAYKKFLAGDISRTQIGSDEDQSSLLRALGNPTRNQPTCFTLPHPVTADDGFLLCSDGAWEYLLDEEILVDFLKADSACTWAELLLLRIMERIPEDNDNLSIITVMVNAEE